MRSLDNGDPGDIYILDDDANVRDALRVILETGGYNAVCFADELALMNELRERHPLCILLDVQLPGKSGLDILVELAEYPVPVIMISGQGNIQVAVQAIKSGAQDFIEKPSMREGFVSRLEKLLEGFSSRNADTPKKQLSLFNFPGSIRLTRREREVLEQITSGSSNKEAAADLGISYRTVEDHRANIMRKLGVKNSTGLMIAVLMGNSQLRKPTSGPLVSPR